MVISFPIQKMRVGNSGRLGHQRGFAEEINAKIPIARTQNLQYQAESKIDPAETGGECDSIGPGSASQAEIKQRIERRKVRRIGGNRKRLESRK